jgi:hypothetical protein
MPRFSFVFLIGIVSLLLACGGGKEKEAQTPKPESGMDDAVALLPSQPIAIGTIDARSFFASKTFGGELTKLVEKYVPLGPEAGFQASRDVDRITFGSYSYQGVDVVAVVVGRFDEAKIKDVAAKHTPTKGGGMLVASQYAGRDVYTVSNVGFTLLSGERALAGTESGIRRVLERIKDGRVKRDVPPWMIETLESPGAAAAVAVDLTTHPMPPEAARQVPVAFVQQARTIRALFSFKEPGVQLAGSLSYLDEPTAQQNAEAIRRLMSKAALLAIIGVKLQNVDIKNEKQDVQLKLDVDDQSLRAALTSASQWLGP